MAVAIGGSLTIRRVTRHAFAGGRVLPPTTSVEYVQTDRRRDEHRGFSGYRVRANGADIYRLNPHTALITRCDLQKTFLVNFDDRQFTEWPIDPLPTRQELRARAESASAVEAPAPTIRVETETVDTGERKEMFGRPARHVITTQRVVPLGAPMREARVSVIYGWYIDLDTRLICEPDWSGLLGHGYLTAHMQGDPPARPMFVRIGEPERGYPVRLKTTDGDSVSEVDVTELSTVPLHPSLFEVSAGFTRVEMIRQEPVPPFVVRLRQSYDRLARRLRIGR